MLRAELYECFCYRYVCSVLSCPQLNISNAALSTNNVTYQTVVDVTCDLGYHVAGGASSALLECSANATWIPTAVHCTG